ncbi:MAG: 16S rRNA (guanine(966)-N(2))-methyltransferase RsmD [Oscillospiraceae bacterium]|nr:16S rRNA (guanine(966)-N(2))-methyltransferase RsmD [Oscillospiraceae bacterium]
MRIITGSGRGRRLAAPPGQDTRPTSELVKEAVFSMIQFEVEGAAVLDIFAGSGQMGIEALSRGARSCVFVENAKPAWQVILANLEHAGFADKAKLIKTDAVLFLQSAPGLFDVAFLDPPYKSGLLEKALPPVARVMRENGVIVIETELNEDVPESAGEFLLYRSYRYGKTKIAQYRQ